MRMITGAIWGAILLAACETGAPPSPHLAVRDAVPVERVSFGMIAMKDQKSFGERYHAFDIVDPSVIPTTIKLDCRIDRTTGEINNCKSPDEYGYSNPFVAAVRAVSGLHIVPTDAMRNGTGELRTDIDVPLNLEGRPILPAAPAAMLSPEQLAWDRAPDAETMQRVRSMLNGLISRQTKIMIACQVQVDRSLACHPPTGDQPLQEIAYRDLYPLAANTQVAATLPGGQPSAGAWVAFQFDLTPSIMMAPPRN